MPEPSGAEVFWTFYPRSQRLPGHLTAVIDAFRGVFDQISSEAGNELSSNEVLAAVSPGLRSLGYEVEGAGRTVIIPVLYGENGKVEKKYNVDAWSAAVGTVVEVEAGTAVANNGFLKDLFQACLLPGVEYLVIAVRTTYKGSSNYRTVQGWFDALYASTRFTIPLKGVLILGY